MKPWVLLFLLTTLVLAGCVPQANGVDNREELANQQQVEEMNQVEERIAEQETADNNSELDENQATKTEENPDHEPDIQEVVAEQPVYVQIPPDTKFEALVLAKGGTKLYAEPSSEATALGHLEFGEHLFALLEIDGWIYVSSDRLEGWVKEEQIKEIPYDSSQKIEVDNPDDLLVLVNKTYRLPRDYQPDDLVIPNVPFPFEGTHEKKLLRAEAAQALEELFAESKKEGLELFAISGYRSFTRQKTIFPNNVLRVGFAQANQFSAFPGESEHQTGLAMDVSSRAVNFNLVEAFAETAEGIWLKENAHRFGFIIRYPKGKEEVTGYTYEPWHLRYVGQETAQKIHELNITLEEYILTIHEKG